MIDVWECELKPDKENKTLASLYFEPHLSTRPLCCLSID